MCHAITYFITTDFIFNLNLTILLLIITLSLYRKRAKNIFTDSLDFKHSQKLPLKSLKLFTLWNEYLIRTYPYTHLDFVVSDQRIHHKEVFNQSSVARLEMSKYRTKTSKLSFFEKNYQTHRTKEPKNQTHKIYIFYNNFIFQTILQPI